MKVIGILFFACVFLLELGAVPALDLKWNYFSSVPNNAHFAGDGDFVLFSASTSQLFKRENQYYSSFDFPAPPEGCSKILHLDSHANTVAFGCEGDNVVYMATVDPMSSSEYMTPYSPGDPILLQEAFFAVGHPNGHSSFPLSSGFVTVHFFPDHHVVESAPEGTYTSFGFALAYANGMLFVCAVNGDNLVDVLVYDLFYDDASSSYVTRLLQIIETPAVFTPDHINALVTDGMHVMVSSPDCKVVHVYAINPQAKTDLERSLDFGSGDWAGSDWDDFSNTEVFIFVQKLSTSCAQPYWGSTLALDGNVLLVAAPHHDTTDTLVSLFHLEKSLEYFATAYAAEHWVEFGSYNPASFIPQACIETGVTPDTFKAFTAFYVDGSVFTLCQSVVYSAVIPVLPAFSLMAPENHAILFNDNLAAPWVLATPGADTPMMQSCVLTADPETVHFLDPQGRLFRAPFFNFNDKTMVAVNDISPYPTFTELSCGASHILLLDASGNVYVMGDNTNGQLGFGALPADAPPLEDTLIYPLAFSANPMFHVYAGDTYSVAWRTAVGGADPSAVYAWGAVPALCRPPLASSTPVEILPFLNVTRFFPNRVAPVVVEGGVAASFCDSEGTVVADHTLDPLLNPLNQVKYFSDPASDELWIVVNGWSDQVVIQKCASNVFGRCTGVSNAEVFSNFDTFVMTEAAPLRDIYFTENATLFLYPSRIKYFGKVDGFSPPNLEPHVRDEGEIVWSEVDQFRNFSHILPVEQGGQLLMVADSCFCNGFSSFCDPETSECVGCDGHRTGPRCERCLSDYFLGDDGVCQPICEASCSTCGSAVSHPTASSIFQSETTGETLVYFSTSVMTAPSTCKVINGFVATPLSVTETAQFTSVAGADFLLGLTVVAGSDGHQLLTSADRPGRAIFDLTANRPIGEDVYHSLSTGPVTYAVGDAFVMSSGIWIPESTPSVGAFFCRVPLAQEHKTACEQCLDILAEGEGPGCKCGAGSYLAPDHLCKTLPTLYASGTPGFEGILGTEAASSQDIVAVTIALIANTVPAEDAWSYRGDSRALTKIVGMGNAFAALFSDGSTLLFGDNSHFQQCGGTEAPNFPFGYDVFTGHRGNC
eukprot:GCRY01000710.1.p1 GENE.GCRY01000710.1~~GCRY01000710.1.p1  ORF type:complete len:1106 (+),score=267.26 GCRY01000710.1:222-3539(+)